MIDARKRFESGNFQTAKYTAGWINYLIQLVVIVEGAVQVIVVVVIVEGSKYRDHASWFVCSV